MTRQRYARRLAAGGAGKKETKQRKTEQNKSISLDNQSRDLRPAGQCSGFRAPLLRPPRARSTFSWAGAQWAWLERARVACPRAARVGAAHALWRRAQSVRSANFSRAASELANVRWRTLRVAAAEEPQRHSHGHGGTLSATLSARVAAGASRKLILRARVQTIQSAATSCVGARPTITLIIIIIIPSLVLQPQVGTKTRAASYSPQPSARASGQRDGANKSEARVSHAKCARPALEH